MREQFFHHNNLKGFTQGFVVGFVSGQGHAVIEQHKDYENSRLVQLRQGL